jgi:hypothetical protein
MTPTRYRHVAFDERGDLVWSGQDLGPNMLGSSEYEFWRTVPKAKLPKLAAALEVPTLAALPEAVGRRFASDVELADFAEAHGIETSFFNWYSPDMDDD